MGNRGAVVKTTNGGAIWTTLPLLPGFSADLEDLLVLGPGQPLAVRANPGIFRSTDERAGWTRINDDAHEFGSPDYCAGDETVFGRVYIAPHGRGILYGQPAK